MTAFNKIMEGREVERKAYKEKVMAEKEDERKKKTGKPTSRRGWPRVKPTEKWRQGWKPFAIRQTPTW
jgi:hypothetical protein